MSTEKFYDDMLFDYETSHRTYYRNGEIKPITKTVYKAKPTCYRIRPPPLKDIHTLIDWKNARVPPFSLLHKSKEIVRTNPWKVQQPYSRKEDVDREEVQKTRPRLVMTPAVSMDDIADPTARKILCTDMYTSEMCRAIRAAVAALPPHPNVKAPLPGLPAPANPITLPKLQPPFVSPEWRMETVSWDNRQLRAHCDPTREFWLKRDPMKERNLIIDDIYTTTAQRSRVLMASMAPSVKASLPAEPTPTNPITLPKLLPPYVSPEWRLQPTAWDRLQLRAYCDPSREFYLTRPLRQAIHEMPVNCKAQTKQMKMKHS